MTRTRGGDGKAPPTAAVRTAPPDSLAGEDLLSISEAADITSVARSTMARWVRSGRFPRATVLQLGQIRAAWYVPITDLIEAGLVTRRRARELPVTRAGRLVVAELEQRIADLTLELDRARADVERLSLLTREQRAIIADLRRRRSRGRSS